MLRFYTSKRFIGDRVSIDDPVAFFDNTVVSKVENGEYHLHKDELNVLTEIADCIGLDGGRVKTKYGYFNLRDIQNGVKTILVVLYCAHTKTDAVVVADKSYCYAPRSHLVGLLLDTAEANNIGLACVYDRIPKRWWKKIILINDRWEVRARALSYTRVYPREWMNARTVTFEYDGNQFDLQFETDSLQIYLDNYEYVLFREGLMNAIDSLGDNVIVVTDDVLSELIADKDEDNHKKYDGKTLIDVDSKIYKCRDWWGITQAGQRITIHQIDAVEDLDNKYVVTLSQDIIGAEDGMNKYRFTVPDVVGHYIYTQDNDEHRDSDFWYNDPFERLDSPRHNPLTERLSGYFDFREKGYVDKDL